MEYQLIEIVRRLLDNDEEWFSSYNIKVLDKKPFWILNYGIGETNSYNYLCRGLVIVQPSDFTDEWLAHDFPFNYIASFPFVRFFNEGEKYSSSVNLSNSDIIEKLDGTLVTTFNLNRQTIFHTRKMISTNKEDMEQDVGFPGQPSYCLMKEIKKYVDDINLNNNDILMFEFIHPSSQVVTKYNESKYGLYLIGGRRRNKFIEYTEEELDVIANKINCRRPRRWKADSYDDIIQIIDSIDDVQNFEGVVIRDGNNRVKFKSEKYVKLHHLLTKISYKDLVPIVLNGESEEVISYFPHAKQLVSDILIRHQNYTFKTMMMVLYYGNLYVTKNMNKKELAQELFAKENDLDPFIKDVVIKSVDMYKSIGYHNVYASIEESLRKLPVKKYIEIVGLNKC